MAALSKRTIAVQVPQRKTIFKKGIYLLPNLLTTGNLFCGVLSIIFSVTDALKLKAYEGMTPPFGVSAWLILGAALFDLFDGMVARLMGASSQFGLEYDSLADLVSFGIAPAIMLYLAVLRYQLQWGIILTIFFVIAGALRLARYNTFKNPEDNKNFVGMPIPSAAGFLASYVLLSRWGGWWYGKKGILFDSVLGWYEENLTFFNTIFVPVMVLLLSCLMVSTLEFPSLNWASKKRLPFMVLVLLVFLMAIAVNSPEMVVFILLSVYLIYALIFNVFKLMRGKKVKSPLLEKKPETKEAFK